MRSMITKMPSQTVVDSALGSLQSAYNSAEMKASNIEELQALVDGKVAMRIRYIQQLLTMLMKSAVNKLAGGA